ncbi:hypothetical protein ABB05_12875 [Lederbergia galactosidilytica]|uniref:Uncharacterized protein n=1 Tax=Lederbergia galactosidilytica TaxID=217031 RepID=A0A177ZPZ5_9BACI|nr:hypothetical protein ABB05_12875 [Lederbergia galactosidilytica]
MMICRFDTKSEVGEIVEVIKYWSFTMDYETNEIVINANVNGDMKQLRVNEKDVESMRSWFDLAKHMKSQ